MAIKHFYHQQSTQKTKCPGIPRIGEPLAHYICTCIKISGKMASVQKHFHYQHSTQNTTFPREIKKKSLESQQLVKNSSLKKVQYCDSTQNIMFILREAFIFIIFQQLQKNQQKKGISTYEKFQTTSLYRIL